MTARRLLISAIAGAAASLLALPAIADGKPDKPPSPKVKPPAPFHVACGMATPHVRFDKDSAKLSKASQRAIAAAAKCLIKGPLAGHDVLAMGRLSQMHRIPPERPGRQDVIMARKRAEAVKRALISQGVAPYAVHAVVDADDRSAEPRTVTLLRPTASPVRPHAVPQPSHYAYRDQHRQSPHSSRQRAASPVAP